MKTSRKIVLGIVTLGALAAVYILNPNLPEPAGEQSARLYRPGELGLTSEALALTDGDRSTMANGDFGGEPFRQLEGRIWYPENRDQGPYPLILYSHGFMSSISEAEYLVEFLVPKGYVLAAVNFPLSSGGAPGGPIVNDVLNQPADVSFVLDALLERNGTEGDSLYGLLDTDRIAAAGLSLGGLTSQLVSYHRDVRDPRIAAAVSIAGPAEFLTPQFFRTTDIPFMMIAGSLDAIIPYPEHAAPIPGKAEDALLVTLEGGTHVGFAGVASTFMRWFRHPDELVCPMLLRGLENGDEPAEAMLQADAEIGISSGLATPCSMSEFPRAMRPGEQQMLTRLAVYAFLESVFAPDSSRREQMSSYLASDLAQEHGAVRVEGW